MECRYWTVLWDGTIWGTLFWMLFHVGHLRTPTVELTGSLLLGITAAFCSSLQELTVPSGLVRKR